MGCVPSGTQYDIVVGRHRASIVEVGGGIRAYTADGHPVLDGYPAKQMCRGARGTPLVPWPNRIADGTYTFTGTRHQLALTEPETHCAIHGLTRWQRWALSQDADDHVALTTMIAPQPGYPFTLHVAVSYHLRDHAQNTTGEHTTGEHHGTGTGGVSARDGLTVTTTATNFGAEPCPYATGAHPYLTAGTDYIDQCDLHLDATAWLPTDERGIPTATTPVENSPYDYRAARRLGDTVIDHAFTGLARDRDGLAWVRLTAPNGRGVRLWVDEHYRYLELYTGDTQAPEVRRRGLGVEPMTCAPNGFATGQDLLTLAPGQSITTRWGIQPDLPPVPQASRFISASQTGHPQK